METAEAVLRFEARVPEIVPGGLVPDGIRLDAHFRESITSGPLMGGTVRGIDDVLIRPDDITPAREEEYSDEFVTSPGYRTTVRVQLRC